MSERISKRIALKNFWNEIDVLRFVRNIIYGGKEADNFVCVSKRPFLGGVLVM